MQTYGIRALSFLLLFSVQALCRGEDAFHTFTSPDGRTLTAAIRLYNPGNGKIQIELESGKKVWTQPKVFSEEDQDYIRQWIEADRFMSARGLKISGDSDKGRTEYREKTLFQHKVKDSGQTKIVYEVTLENRSTSSFENLAVEYRAFILRRGYQGLKDSQRIEGGSFKIAEIPANGRISEKLAPIVLRTAFRHDVIFYTDGSKNVTEIKTGEEYLKGFWVKVYGPSIDGKRAVQEWCYPSDTMDHYAWRDASTAPTR